VTSRYNIFFFLATGLLLLFPHGAMAQSKDMTFRYQEIIGQANLVTDCRPLHLALFLPPQEDTRVTKLQGYLSSQKSPLAAHSEYIIQTADRFGLDWRLLVAIAGVESGFGKVMPRNSYNAYGWANGATRFESWENSISHVSMVLSEKYLGRGLKTPSQIARKYCPGSDTWAQRVTSYMNDIANFSPRT